MFSITPKIAYLGKVSNVLNISKPLNISFKGNNYDVFEKSGEVDRYEFDTRKTLQKLKSGEISKEYLDEFLMRFNGVDRKFAQEILVQSSPNLSYCNLLGQLRYFKNKCNLNGIELVKLSSFSQMIKYFAQRQNLRMFSPINYSNESNRALGKFGVIDGVFSRELTNEEVELLSDLRHLSIINLNDFEVMPNFIDFAISDKKAQEKIESVIKIAKEILQNNPELSIKEAITKAKRQTLQKNLDRINSLRQEKNKPPVKNYSTKASIGTYEEIKKELNSISNLPLPLSQQPEEFLREMIEANFQKPQELMSALASNEFTYYSPKKLIESLKELIKKVKKQLLDDDINVDDCLFVYKDSKSEAFFCHLLQEMGEIQKEQCITYDDAIKYLNENKDKDNCIVYIDDILGSGDTTERYVCELKNCKKYCAHIVSCAKGRDYLEDYDVEQIYVKKSFNGSRSKNKLISFHSLPDMFSFLLGQSCYASEIFFYSYPDVASGPYQDFAHKILGIEQRKEYP